MPGQLFGTIGNFALTEDDFAKYPAIFRPLEWYEERTIEEMPEYARDENGAVFNTEWNLPNGQYKPNMFPTRMASILPATEEEYNAFQIAKLKEQK